MRHVTFLLALFTATITASAQPATQPATQPAGGFFGARLASVDDQLADERGLDVDSGVLVDDLLPDSPAEKAGIQERDVIQKIDGQPIKELPDLQRMLRGSKPGQVMTFTVLRGSETKDIKVTLGTRPPNMPAAPTTRPG
jgi:S1-C subfamily serine protease